MLRDHFLTGVGFGGYQHALLARYSDFLPSTLNTPNLDTLSHASMVTGLAEQGVIGTSLLVAFLVALGVEALRRRSTWTVISATLIVPIFIYSQIEGRFTQDPISGLRSDCSTRRSSIELGLLPPPSEFRHLPCCTKNVKLPS